MDGIADLQMESSSDLVEHQNYLYSIGATPSLTEGYVMRYAGAWGKLNDQQFIADFGYPNLNTIAVWKDVLYLGGSFHIKDTEIRHFARFKLLNVLNLGCDAVNDRDTTDENIPLEIPVRANDSDSNGDYLLTTIIEQGEHGTATVTSGDNILYTSDTDYTGFDTLRYKVCDQGGLCDSAYVYLVINDDPNGIMVSPIHTFRIYPNPAGSKITIHSEAEGTQEIKLFDMAGNVITTATFTGSYYFISLTDLSAGIYTLQLITDKGISRQKLIKN